jgi:DNA invertase Pin-like site-specific DNA recombinase
MSKDNGIGPDLTGTGAAYVRVSTDQQDTIRQHKAIHAFEGRYGVTIPKEMWFEDHGLSRDAADRRPQFQRLIALSEAGKVQWIVVDALDRFGTKSSKQLIVYLYRLEEARCRLYDAGGKEWTGEDFATEITALLGGKQSAKEQRDKSYRTLGGHVEHAEDGEAQGGTSPFGLDKACYSRADPDKELWRVVYQGGKVTSRKPDKRGKMKSVYSLYRLRVYPDGREERWDGPDNFPPHQKTTEVLRLAPSQDPKKIEALKAVFRTYATEAVSFADLARYLNERGFRTACGGRFQSVHIQRMLENPTYMGNYTYGRRHSGKFHRHTKEGRVTPEENYGEKESKNDRADWVVSERLLFDPLIEAGVWKKVQQKLAGRGKRPRTPQSPYEYLNGLVYCGNCPGGPEQMRPRALKRRGEVRYEYCCSTYHGYCRTGRAAESPCRRNRAWQGEVETYVKQWLEDAGTSWDLLMQDVKVALKSGAMPDVREGKVDDYWQAFRDGLDRVMTYLADQHPDEYHAILKDSEARREAEEREAADPTPAKPGGLHKKYGKKLDESVKKHAKDPVVFHKVGSAQEDFIDACLACYRTHYDPHALQAEIDRLEAQHTAMTKGWADLPTPRAKEKAKAELAALEARIASLEKQRQETAESVADHYRQMLDLERSISEAREAFKGEEGERKYRLLAEKLREAIQRITCHFVATGEERPGHLTAKLVSVTIEPYEGEPKTYPTLYYDGTTVADGSTPAGRSRSSGSRPRC